MPSGGGPAGAGTPGDRGGSRRGTRPRPRQRRRHRWQYPRRTAGAPRRRPSGALVVPRAVTVRETPPDTGRASKERPGEKKQQQRKRNGANGAPAPRSGRRATRTREASAGARAAPPRDARTRQAAGRQGPPRLTQCTYRHPTDKGPRIKRSAPSCHTAHTEATGGSRSRGGQPALPAGTGRCVCASLAATPRPHAADDARGGVGENRRVPQQRPPRWPARASGRRRGGGHGTGIRPDLNAYRGRLSTDDGRGVADPRGTALHGKRLPPTLPVCLLQTPVDGGETALQVMAGEERGGRGGLRRRLGHLVLRPGQQDQNLFQFDAASSAGPASTRQSSGNLYFDVEQDLFVVSLL